MSGGTNLIYEMGARGRDARFPVRWSADVFDDPSCHEALAEGRSLMITTPTVARLYADGIERLRKSSDAALLVLGVTESGKSLAAVEQICVAAAEHGLGRRDQIVAVGGGVCLDLVTVAASLYRRGIAHMRIPTTVIGQVDAGIGAKGAVNHNGGKNTLGCFHPPSKVFVDRSLLATVPVRDVRSGLAEIVKMAVIGDLELFQVLEKYGPSLAESHFQWPGTVAEGVLDRSIVLMADELAPNLFEDRTLERKVDAGHTFSPKIEARSGFTLTHGEAVSIDLAYSASLASELGILGEAEACRIIMLLIDLGLPVDTKHLQLALCRDAIAEAARHRGGRANLPLPSEIGVIQFISQASALDANVLRRALERHREFSRQLAARSR